MNQVVVRALVLALLACSLPLAATAAGAPAGESSQSIAGDALASANDDPAANETPPHQNPDEYDEAGDDEELESWLSDQLSDQLGDSSVALSEGQYEQAREHLGDDYDERLEQYAEVSGDTGDEDDSAEAYRNASESQERMADTIEEYDETRAEYEEALQEGDQERAHDLARELEALSNEIDEAGEDAVTSYETIDNETDEDHSDSAASVNESRSEIESEQTAVRDEQFVETELDLEVVDETASLEDPMVVRGAVRTADGEPIEGDLEIRVEDEPVAVGEPSGDWWAGDENEFEFEYRPTDLALDEETVTVEYVPDGDTNYLGAEQEVEVTPEQTTATIDDLTATDEVAYGDPLSVSGTVTAAGEPVDDVPVAITVDGELIGTVNASEGNFEGEVETPANVSAGEGTVTASLPYEDRTLTATPAEAPISVAETETELTATATAIGDEEVAIDGSLATADGEPLDNQTLEIQVDGVAAETVETDEDGGIAGTVDTGSVDGDEVTVAVSYDGAGSNMAAAEAEETVTMPDGGDSLPVPQSAIVGIGALLGIGVLGLAGWWRRRSRRDDLDRAPSIAVGGPTRGPDPAMTQDRIDALLDRAAEQLADGRTDTAVRTAHAAVRHAYGSAVGRPGAATHWEFYREHADDTADGVPLRELVETYEQAAFTPDQVTEEQAERAVETAERLCEEADLEATTGSASAAA
ncbi:hypothetical protein C491_16537 [Natronococcus amylolyticus DSM 10524]|uniref:DUF4129 domain-containing protein n=1 Tax=Natronococcus amylolyticus DSM 10524 TaxID=1227497 RepID=L9X1J5_9EURY|nr:hypothetical protein [Natronococcus amylolyticus]ELY55341.1 hypothetical protein C491_16537 [Natronococcus amylolyticus DSM 10524]